MTIAFRTLSPPVAVEVTGVDLHRELPAEIVSSIARAWDEHGVLVFRDQQLSTEDQIRFARYFGELQETRGGPRAGTDFSFIGNVTIDGLPADLPYGEVTFHQDGGYAERPPRSTSLFALEIPSAGGNTIFCSTGGVYTSLPADLQRRLLEYDVHFSHNYAAEHDKPAAQSQSTDDDFHCTHPLVIAHPSTGRPLLFCNRLMAESIVGLPRAESTELIERLCTLMELPERVYEHVWRVGDFVAWDNLAVEHARTYFDPSERRALRRMQTIGEKLLAYRTAARAAV